MIKEKDKHKQRLEEKIDRLSTQLEQSDLIFGRLRLQEELTPVHIPRCGNTTHRRLIAFTNSNNINPTTHIRHLHSHTFHDRSCECALAVGLCM